MTPKKILIEVALPLEAINKVSVRYRVAHRPHCVWLEIRGEPDTSMTSMYNDFAEQSSGRRVHP